MNITVSYMQKMCIICNSSSEESALILHFIFSKSHLRSGLHCLQSAIKSADFDTIYFANCPHAYFFYIHAGCYSGKGQIHTLMSDPTHYNRQILDPLMSGVEFSD